MDKKTIDAANAISKDSCKIWNIPHPLHQSDYILIDAISKFGLENAVHSYLHSGRHEAHQLIAVIDKLFKDDQSLRVLDFASGYGRVVRHLNHFSNRINPVAADIHPEAVDFMSDQLHIDSHLSSIDPVAANIGCEYKFIYVLSLFSHLPEFLFSAWLEKLYKILAPGGYILFTTHGEKSIASNPEFFNKFYNDSRGFGFKPISEQLDLETSTYGTTVVSPSFVFSLVKRILPDSILHSFDSGKWFGFAAQDEYIINKPIL